MGQKKYFICLLKTKFLILILNKKLTNHSLKFKIVKYYNYYYNFNIRAHFLQKSLYLDVFLWLIRVFIILVRGCNIITSMPTINTEENVNSLNKGYTFQFPKTPLPVVSLAFICTSCADIKVFQFATSMLDEIMFHYFCPSDVLRTFWSQGIEGLVFQPDFTLMPILF